MSAVGTTRTCRDVRPTWPLTDIGASGIALVGTGLAAWSPPAPNHPAARVRALFVYNLLATLYLGYLGIDGHLVGILLWPAVALHAVFSAALAPGCLPPKPD
jgi:hypothetical protein